MPTATKATRRRAPRPVELDPDAVAEFVESDVKQDPSPNHERFNPFDESIPFLNAIAMIAESEWERYLIYLYRLDPRVRNPEGEAAFIDKYQRPIDEGDIKAVHGGGKYMLLLKDDVQWRNGAPAAGARERRHKLRIAGDPVLQQGQTTVGKEPVVLPPGPTPPPSDRSLGTGDVAALLTGLREILADRKGDDGIASVLELMGQANKSAIQVVTEAARQSATSTTGNPIMDKLLEKLIDSKINGGGERDGVRDKLVNIALDRLSNPQPTAGADGGLAQLGQLKELFGVDSVMDLVKGGGGDNSWKMKLVEVGGALITNLPALVQAFMQNQQMLFNRQMQVEAMRRQAAASPGQPVVVPPNTPTPVDAIPPAIAAPAPPMPGVEPVSFMNPVQAVLDDIVNCFNSGLGGDGAASLIMTKYPAIVEQLRQAKFASGKSLFEDVEELKAFSAKTPPLSAIAGEEEFPQFLGEFVEEMNRPDEPDQQPPAA